MNNSINNFIKKYGLFYALFKIPVIAVQISRMKIMLLFWRLILKKVGKDVSIGLGVKFSNPKNVTIGNNVIIGKRTRIESENAEGTILINDNVQINQNCFIDHSGHTIIGENTLISANTQIFSHSHGYDPRSKSIGLEKRIGKNVWIGTRSLLSEKVANVEDSIIIAAGSVVTKNCDIKNSIYGGNPAKFIKSKVGEK